MTTEFATIDDPDAPQHTPGERAAAASRNTWVSVVVSIVLSCTQITIGVLAKSQRLHAVALAVAAVALVSKEILFRYMLKVAQRIKSSMLVANAWHARSDAASSLVVGIGIAVAARRNVMARHRVLSVMTHVDPWRRPALDHASVRVAEKSSGATT